MITSFKLAERKFRVVISTGPTAADDRAIYIKAATSDLALHKANEYCKHRNIQNPSILVEE